ncbi:hypothetical protein CkaCkLH20_06595 [Colletotrichum karsti]|uniref:Uncharacterized protein n=1 Tax=Colletotrichum karsti TaxID=1095194 RepID=A0A9P6LHD2_9PEZI|nr:uncharacterized protein CkaCkLH20_06595 [Colletotrichum karsti]KAF9876149.1 hypothetical protein CkaCkLH20_06595 [Colletotrichum karsti]
MCKKLFELRRCLSTANGGCDKYWAEIIGHEGCGGGSHGGMPQADCRCAWAGFESLVSTQVNRHEFYIRRAIICPRCLHRQDLDRLRAEAEREQRGEFSESMRSTMSTAERNHALQMTELENKVYYGLWDAVHNLTGGLARHADTVWEGIETALYGHFGVTGLAQTPVQGLVATLQDAKKSLVDHVKKTTREMATGLVGSRDTREVDEEDKRFEEKENEKRQEAMLRAVEAAEAAHREAASGTPNAPNAPSQLPSPMPDRVQSDIRFASPMSE